MGIEIEAEPIEKKDIVVPDEFKAGNIDWEDKTKVDAALAWMDSLPPIITMTESELLAREAAQAEKQRLRDIKRLRNIIGEPEPVP